jgi:hypothetical protein
VKVRILHHPTISPGTVIDASETEAAHLIRTGRGEVVMQQIETAMVAPSENAAVRTTRPTARKK